jgi:hypothetical protein
MVFKLGISNALKAVIVKSLISRVDGQSAPNINNLTTLTNRIDALSLSVKFFGYELARSLADALPSCEGAPLREVDLASKPSTQADIASDWLAHWCGELKIPRVFHRKIWELAYVLQAIHNHGSLRPGAKGLGFGCGREPLPAYLASQGVTVTVTDQPPESMSHQGWTQTGQHTGSVEESFHPHLIERAVFDRQVSLRYVDMNAIPSDITGYDFCWSVCAFEHLGSIEQGLAFVENSLKTVRPGGLSVHTTEFNFANDHETIDNWATVLFQRRHFQELARRLEAKGHKVAPLDFDVGNMPLDKFIDIPPYLHDGGNDQMLAWERDGTPHIKLAIDGFASTCFGFIVERAE